MTISDSDSAEEEIDHFDDVYICIYFNISKSIRNHEMDFSAISTAVILSVLGFLTLAKADCPPVPQPDFTEMTCDNGTNQGSECELECYPGFVVLPESDDPFQVVINCQDDDAWDKPFPYCGKICPPNAKADVVFVIDSSSSMRGVTRRLMKAFLREMISSWTISSGNVNVAVVPYNTEVNYQSVVTLKAYSNDKDGLLEAVGNIGRNKPGSFTGKALTFTLDNVLTSANGNRPDAPDVVIVMTDGRGQNNIDPPLAKLWELGVTTYAVGFNPRRRMPFLTRQLMKIAQNIPERMHLTMRNNLGNTDALMHHLRGIYCLQPARCNSNMSSTPANGMMLCSDGSEVGSVCSFACNEGFLLEGDRNSTCISGITGTPAWTGTTPACTPGECSPTRNTLSNGDVVCSNENRVGSVCEFQCTARGYELFPTNRTINTCLPSTVWDEDAPCCTRPCPPHALMDAVIVLDSSSSIGAENWIATKRFVRSILESFTVDSDATNFAVVRYNRQVDIVNQIRLRDFPNDREGLVTAFDRIPYNGSGTFTGQAIQHVVDNLLTVEAGNRPNVADVVIIITDGKAADDVLTPSDRLRATGATILVIAITPRRGNLDLVQLRQIAGSTSNLFNVTGGFEELDKSFALQISDKACGDPCGR